MKRDSYVRLKVNMTLGAAAQAAAVTALSAFLLRALVGKEEVTDLYRAAARGLFGQSAQEAEAFYYGVLLPGWPVILGVIFALSLLVGMYRSVGKLTGWFERIREGAAGMREDVERAVLLPKELAAVEEDLNAARLRVAQREREAAESAERARDLVVYLAHDLKTPLTSVVGYLELLREQPGLEREQREKYTGIALEKARRLEKLIGEFFDINRLELESIEKAGQQLDLTMLLEQLSDEFWPLFEEKNLTLRSAISPGLRVWGDPDKLARVFDNVLRNAVSYSVPGGTVGLRAFRQGGELVITVDNEGLEIPESELSHIFEKFYRLDAARSTQTGGFGLGLAIAKEIVERHRGSIRAESNGKRVTFTILLPAR